MHIVHLMSHGTFILLCEIHTLSLSSYRFSFFFLVSLRNFTKYFFFSYCFLRGIRCTIGQKQCQEVSICESFLKRHIYVSHFNDMF